MQEPVFFRRQVLVKFSPGSISVPSGIVTSETKAARSHGAASVGAVVLVGIVVGTLVAEGRTTLTEVSVGIAVVGSGWLPDAAFWVNRATTVRAVDVFTASGPETTSV